MSSSSRYRSRKQQAKHTNRKPKKGQKFYSVRDEEKEFEVKEKRRVN